MWKINHITLREHQKLLTEIWHVRNQLLPFNMEVYGELVFQIFHLHVFTYPVNLFMKKIAMMMRAILCRDFPLMHRDVRDVDRFGIVHHILMSTSLSSLCI